MDQQNELNERPRYKWPWFVLGAVVLGIVLAIIWMVVLIQRTREQRENSWPPQTRSSLQTNVSTGTNGYR
jgi:hypothetical protein